MRQGAPPSLLLFLYNVDPVILLYNGPVLGPLLPDQPPLPDQSDKYTIKGYAVAR